MRSVSGTRFAPAVPHSQPSAPHKTALQIMRPALGMREPALLRVAFVGPVAIGEQYRPLRGRVGTQGLRDVLAATTLVIGEADLVMLAIDGPEVAPFILPVPLRPALIGVSSMALTRLWRIDSSCAV
jgi:hypothetical protein